MLVVLGQCEGLDLDAEAVIIEKCKQSTPNAQNVIVDVLSSPTRQELRERCGCGEQWHYFHFSGHSDKRGLALGTGENEFVTLRALRQILEPQEKLVGIILNACKTADLRGVCQSLRGKIDVNLLWPQCCRICAQETLGVCLFRVPPSTADGFRQKVAVVATCRPISDRYASAFSLGFYQRIFQRKSMWQAFESGKRAVGVEFQNPYLHDNPGGSFFYLYAFLVYPIALCTATVRLSRAEPG